MSIKKEKLSEYRKRAEGLVKQMTLEEKVAQTLNQAPAIERLGIKAYNWWNEALHGVARAGTATVFPQAIGLAATFDEDLMEQIGEAVSTEARGKFNMQQAGNDTDIYKGLTFWRRTSISFATQDGEEDMRLSGKTHILLQEWVFAILKDFREMMKIT